MIPRFVFLILALLLLSAAVFLPVDAIVDRSISPAMRREVVEKTGPERLQQLQVQFAEGLNYFRIAAAVMGIWLLGLAAGWKRLMEFRARYASSALPPKDKRIGSLDLLLLSAWILLTLLIAMPLMFKGYDHQELLLVEMLAKRGPLVSMAMQNVPPRAAQPAFSVIQSLFVAALGDAEWVARLPALIFGAATMLPLFFVARRLAGSCFAHLTCGLLILLPIFHFRITYGRGYSLAMFALWMAILMAMRAVEHNRRREWIWNAAFIFIACYSHMSLGISAVFLSLAAAVHAARMHAGQAPEQPRFARAAADLIPAFVVLGTTALLLAVVYSVGIPVEIRYLRTFGVSDYYTAYQPGSRLFIVMIELWTYWRGYPAAAWIHFGLFVAGTLALVRRCRWKSICYLATCVGPVLVLIAMDHFIYPRFFLFYMPGYIIGTAYAIHAVITRAAGRSSRNATAIVLVVLAIMTVPAFQRLYRMERCGVRTAVNDAREIMQPGDRLAGTLDGFITLRHYYPNAVSMERDTEFWALLQSGAPPEFIVNVPYLEMDIPGGADALLQRYDLYKAYPGWMDIDNDYDSVYLYRLKNKN